MFLNMDSVNLRCYTKIVSDLVNGLEFPEGALSVLLYTEGVLQ